jgi:hypothetical protein
MADGNIFLNPKWNRFSSVLLFPERFFPSQLFFSRLVQSQFFSSHKTFKVKMLWQEKNEKIN